MRIGTPAATSRGMNTEHMQQIAHWLVRALREADNEKAIAAMCEEVVNFCRQFPVPGLE